MSFSPVTNEKKNPRFSQDNKNVAKTDHSIKKTPLGS